MSKEIWKDVKGYEGYYSVSNRGIVKSLDRVIDHHGNGLFTRKRKGIILSQYEHKGYFYLTLSLNGVRKKQLVHRVVASTFIQNPENKRTVNHIDGDKSNNNVDNLEWATSAENNQHAYDTGLFTTFGENQPTSILKYDEVVKIRELHKTGKYLHRELAEMFGMSRRHIGNIVNNKRWATMDENKSRVNEII